jgi:hypothetical protein
MNHRTKTIGAYVIALLIGLSMLPLGAKAQVTLDVLPHYASHNPIHCRAANSEVLGNQFPIAAAISVPDFNNFILRKFMTTMVFSAGMFHWSQQPRASFLVAISLICFIRAKEQMVWSDASWRIALMQHPQTVWDWAKMYSPRKPMGCLFRGSISRIKPYFTILPGFPFPVYPAPSAFMYISPESFYRWHSHSRFFTCNTIRASAAAIFGFFARRLENAFAV